MAEDTGTASECIELPKAQRIKKMIARLRSEAEDALACRLFFEVSNTRASIAAFENRKAKCAVLVRLAIMQRHVMTLLRMHDPIEQKCDSLPLVFVMLEDTQARVGVTCCGGDGDMSRAIEYWHDLREDNRIKRLRSMRNVMIAHTITRKWEKFDQPQLNDLLSVSRDTELIVEHLAIGAGCNTITLKSVCSVWRPHIEDYWNRLQNS